MALRSTPMTIENSQLKWLHRTLLAASAIGCVFAISPQAQAATLFSQTFARADLYTGQRSDVEPVPSAGAYFQAENFTLTSDSLVTDVFWQGFYYSGTGSTTPQSVDDFTISFYNDSGLVGSFITSFDVGNDVNRTDTGENFGIPDIFNYNASIAGGLLLSAGSYWVSVVNDTTVDTNNNWYWSVAGADAGDGSASSPNGGTSWGFTSPNKYLVLEGTVSAVPLPAALPLFATTLAGMGFFGWRRKRSAA